MEPLTLITNALEFASPYLVKTGEKFAEKVGKEVWNALKKPFQNSEKEKLFNNSPSDDQINEIKQVLLQKFESDPRFKNDIENMVAKAEKDLGNQQTINNNGNIGKQLNIQSNSGNINL